MRTLDIAYSYESEGRAFESLRAHHYLENFAPYGFAPSNLASFDFEVGQAEGHVFGYAVASRVRDSVSFRNA